MLIIQIIRVSGNSSWSTAMCDSLVGLVIEATDHPNCFIISTEHFLGAVQAQRPGVLHLWQNEFGQCNSPIFLGKTEGKKIGMYIQVDFAEDLLS